MSDKDLKITSSLILSSNSHDKMTLFITMRKNGGERWFSEELWIDEIKGSTPDDLADSLQVWIDKLRNIDTTPKDYSNES